MQMSARMSHQTRSSNSFRYGAPDIPLGADVPEDGAKHKRNDDREPKPHAAQHRAISAVKGLLSHSLGSEHFIAKIQESASRIRFRMHHPHGSNVCTSRTADYVVKTPKHSAS